MDLGEEVALVTGASRGIGLGIALELARRGATVVGTATTVEGARSIERRFAEAGVAGHGARLDVTESDGVVRFLESLDGESRTPTVLVNNAGITRDNLLMRMKEDQWDIILQTNLTSVYRMCRAVLRGMLKARHGRIVNIGSVVGATGNAGQCNYAAAKAGIEGFTRALAREVGGRGITVNTVAPGFIETDMTGQLSAEQRAALVDEIPLGRLGTPADVAKTVCFLASPDAAYVTGATLHVNGGMYMG